MKLLYIHARDLKFEAGPSGHNRSNQKRNEVLMRKKLGSALPELTPINRSLQSANALLVWVCAEKGDEQLKLELIRDDIIRARAVLGVLEIVVCPFGHLSTNPAEAMLARKITEDLGILVQTTYPETKTVPFGWDKSVDFHTPRHHYNVAFRSFTPEFLP